MSLEDASLIEAAEEASKNAFTPITGFKVGAAILSSSGVYVGCNVEFVNLSNTIHAEEAAISDFIVYNGVGIIDKIAVYTTGDNKLYFPCGMCLQSLFELSGKDLPVIASNEVIFREKKMEELMPHGFKL